MLNDKLNAVHARWRDRILAQQIIDVRHVPGKINIIVDGISRKWEGLPRQMGDGSEWTICEDWEATAGLINDILHVAPDSETEVLKERFKDEPIFKEVLMQYWLSTVIAVYTIADVHGTGRLNTWSKMGNYVGILRGHQA